MATLGGRNAFDRYIANNREEHRPRAGSYMRGERYSDGSDCSDCSDCSNGVR